jgi:hypothetical protein
MSTAGGGPIISTGITTGDTGGGGAHTHPGSGGAHSHPATSTFTGSPHTHTISAPATSNFSGTAINLAIKYLDVITATKN